MNYALGHAFNSTDLFNNFPVKKLKMTTQECVEQYPDGSKRDFAKSIFITCVLMIIEDIIENNVLFQLPKMGTTDAYMYMKKFTGKNFKNAFKRGKWNDVDFLETNFTGYLIYITMLNKKRITKEKSIYLNPKYRNKITELVNLGKLY